LNPCTIIIFSSTRYFLKHPLVSKVEAEEEKGYAGTPHRHTPRVKKERHRINAENKAGGDVGENLIHQAGRLSSLISETAAGDYQI
jgi:hypothetical protein